MPDTETPAKTAAPAKPKGIKVVEADADWGLPKRDENGFELDADGLPINGVARAIALATAGKSTDPTGQVSDDAIAAHDPKPAEADRVAIEQHFAAKAEAEQKTAAAAADTDANKET